MLDTNDLFRNLKIYALFTNFLSSVIKNAESEFKIYQIYLILTFADWWLVKL